MTAPWSAAADERLIAVQAQKGLAETRSYKDIARGGHDRDPTKTVTIITSHVQYEMASVPRQNPARFELQKLQGFGMKG